MNEMDQQLQPPREITARNRREDSSRRRRLQQPGDDWTVTALPDLPDEQIGRTGRARRRMRGCGDDYDMAINLPSHRDTTQILESVIFYHDCVGSDDDWIDERHPGHDAWNLQQHRRRQGEIDDAVNYEPPTDYKTWETVYAALVLVGMFVLLIMNRVGTDHAMVMAVAAFWVAGIISVQEGTEGFANEGLLTVVALFVVAGGISQTGALHWYMGKPLGHPRSVPAAQLRLVVPVLTASFMNNTAIVAVMIPVVQRWSKSINMSSQHFLMPLCFACTLGGTCTLIGTSTNLVVAGLYQKRYPDVPGLSLFAIARFGVPSLLRAGHSCW